MQEARISRAFLVWACDFDTQAYAGGLMSKSHDVVIRFRLMHVRRLPTIEA